MVHSYKLYIPTYRRHIGSLEDGCSFVDLIEHGHVDHLCTRPDGRRQQLPVKATALTWYGAYGFDVVGEFMYAEVMPAETRVYTRYVVHMVTGTPFHITQHHIPVPVHIIM